MFKEAWSKYKKIVSATVLILVGVIVGTVFFYKGPNGVGNLSNLNVEENSYISVGEEQIIGVDETPETATTTEQGVVQVPVKRLTYTEAVKMYGSQGNNFRFQFSNCQGNPGRLTVKKGANFMLDNRDNTKHAIAIGAQKYNLGAYGFAIVSITKTGLQKITCDGGGSAEVLVQ